MNRFTAITLATSFMLGGVSGLAAEVKPLRDGKVTRAYNVAAPEKSVEDNSIISEAPEGKVMKMSRSGMAYYTFFGEPKWGEYYGMCAEIVECENGDVYIKDPISHAPSFSYIRGKREGSKVVLDMPQPVLSLHNEDGSLMYFYTDLFQFSEENNWFFQAGSESAKELGLPDIEDKMVIEIGDAGTYSFIAPDEGNVILGLCSDNEADGWLAFGEAVSVWEVFDDEYVYAPDGIEYIPMAMTHEDGAYFVSVGFDGDDVYFKGLFKELPQSIVKGVIDGDEIEIKPGQYIGISNLENGLSYYTYLMTAKANRVWSEAYSIWETTFEKADSFSFTYDKENGSLSATDDMSALIMNCGDVILDDVAYLINPSMTIQADGISRTPANPYNLEYVSDFGLPHLSFDLPVVNIDGEVLDINNLYYRIYVDGDEYTFYPDEFAGIGDKEMTLVPYSLQNTGNDFIVNGYNHIIYFDLVDVETFGVQLLYVDNGEVEGESEIVTIAADTTSATTPANPYELVYSDDWGLYMFQFRLPDFNVDNEKIDTNNLYYKIFVDNKESTFYPNDYPGLDKPMTLIPYSFEDPEYDFIATGDLHDVYFRNGEAGSYGVQLFYIVDGVICGQSDIVTCSTPSTIEMFDSERTVATEKYYNLSGAEVSMPAGGVFVKVVTFTDGTRKSFKVIGK